MEGEDFLKVSRKVGRLCPGQSHVERFETRGKGSSLVLTASYDWNNASNSIARAISLRAASKTSDFLTIAIPSILSLLGVLLGAWLAAKFTKAQAREHARIEWARMLFEKYEGAYRRFLLGWGGSAIPSILKAEFDILKAEALVPSSIVDSYSKTFEILSDAKNSDDEKGKASRLFRKAVENWIAHASDRL